LRMRLPVLRPLLSGARAVAAQVHHGETRRAHRDAGKVPGPAVHRVVLHGWGE
jgi:hypothetical protein